MLMMIAANCFAFTNNPEILNDMYKNPNNYICLGGAGTGVLIFLKKNSINVQKYSHQNYIISTQWITFTVHGVKEGNNWREIKSASLGRYERYLYNYDEKKIYVENKDDKKWQLLDISKANGSNSSLMSKQIDSAEISFYLAYNMSFYDEPISELLKSYLKTGKWKTFDE